MEEWFLDLLLIAIAVAVVIALVEYLSTAALLSPSHYADRLMKKVLEGIVAQEELDDGLRDEARAILEAGNNVAWFEWVKHNQDQLSGELLKTAKRAMKIKKFAIVFALSVIALLVMLAVIFGENEAPQRTFELWKR